MQNNITARQKLLTLSTFFFFFPSSNTAGCTEVGRWFRIYHFAWQSLAVVCTCRKGALHPCMCAQVTFIHTCISKCDTSSCAASKSKCCGASHTFSFKTELYPIIFRLCLKNQLLHSLNHCCPVLTQKSLACRNAPFFTSRRSHMLIQRQLLV